MKISRLADYAVLICCTLGREQSCLYNVATLADATGLGQATVSKLMKMLCKAEVVTSCRGVKGGYSLAQPLSQTTVQAVVEAVDGPIALTQCMHRNGPGCSVESLCGLKPGWHKINQAVQTALGSVSLAELMQSGPAHSGPMQDAR